MLPHLVTSIDGKREAIFFLRQHEHIVVARHWLNPKLRGDLDFIAWDSTVLFFIEIKIGSRRSSDRR